MSLFLNFIFSLDATETTTMGRMINDATGKSANCCMKVIELAKTPHLCLFATRKILSSEEIRYDYGVTNLPWRKQPKVPNIYLILKILTLVQRYN
jgi:hypothetical protein